jgi:hypothetical protein
MSGPAHSAEGLYGSCRCSSGIGLPVAVSIITVGLKKISGVQGERETLKVQRAECR